MISSLILNTTHDQMELKEISDLGNTCFLISVLQALLSVTCFYEGLAGLQHNRKKCTSSRTGLENVSNVILARQNSGNIDIGLEDKILAGSPGNNLNINTVLFIQVHYFMTTYFNKLCIYI